MLIYHVFADHGTESEVLTDYGRVVRVSIEPTDTNDSEPIKADATKPLPLTETADLAVLHPPCTRWSPMTSISGNREDHPNLIPDARRIGREYAEHYIIENVPTAPLRDPVVLDGQMFGLPIKVSRAFETSFPVEQPPRYATLNADAETSPYYYSDRSKEWWAVVKGYSTNYAKQHLAKNTIPAPFIRYLLRAWMVEARDGITGADYASHDELDVEAARAANEQLGIYADGGGLLDAVEGGKSP